jgi:hypothetical protein
MEGSCLLMAESGVAFAAFAVQLGTLGDVVDTKLQAEYEKAEADVRRGVPAHDLREGAP